MTTRRSGFALLATLWLVVAIGVVSVEWGRSVRDHRTAVINELDLQTARLAAESGLAHATAFLDDQLGRLGMRTSGNSLSSPAPWAGLAATFADSIGEPRVAGWRATLEPAGTRLDLNDTDVDGLRRFLEALRVDAGDAERIAHSIADWRDADDAHRARGAERDWYQQAGRLVLPANRPYQSVAELRNVRGMTETVFARAAPMLTVNNGGRINLIAAPRPVLLALPGIGEEMVRLLRRRRSENRPVEAIHMLGEELSAEARALLYGHLPELTAVATTQFETVRVVSVGRVQGSPVTVRIEAIVARSGNAASVVSRAVTP